MTDQTGIERLRVWFEKHPDQKRIHQWLAKELTEASRAYYYDGTSTMSDAEYDLKMRMLQGMETLFPELQTPDSPTQKVMH